MKLKACIYQRPFKLLIIRRSVCIHPPARIHVNFQFYIRFSVARFQKRKKKQHFFMIKLFEDRVNDDKIVRNLTKKLFKSILKWIIAGLQSILQSILLVDILPSTSGFTSSLLLPDSQKMWKNTFFSYQSASPNE